MKRQTVRNVKDDQPFAMNADLLSQLELDNDPFNLQLSAPANQAEDYTTQDLFTSAE